MDEELMINYDAPISHVPMIQWFPGHMAKTRRLMSENLKMVDIVVELTDARIPQSSRNPEIDKLLENKPRIVLLNKCDAADETITRDWIAYYKSIGVPAIATDCKSGKGLKQLLPMVYDILSDTMEKRKNKGMSGKPLAMMIVGVPNVGKSSFINRLAGSKRAKVEDRPGVTRGKQWVRIDANLDLLDMPGVLWPKFEDQTVGENLAFTGAVKDDILDIVLVAMRLLRILQKDYANLLCERYKVENIETLSPYELLEEIGRKRGMLISKGEINTERAAIMLMDEFRSGKIGRISLEHPPMVEGAHA